MSAKYRIATKTLRSTAQNPNHFNNIQRAMKKMQECSQNIHFASLMAPPYDGKKPPAQKFFTFNFAGLIKKALEPQKVGMNIDSMLAVTSLGSLEERKL